MRQAVAIALCSIIAVSLFTGVVGYGIGAGLFVDDELRHRRLLQKAGQGDTDSSNAIGILYHENRLDQEIADDLVQLAVNKSQDYSDKWDEAFGTILEFAWIRGDLYPDQWEVFLDGAVDPLVESAIFYPEAKEITLHMWHDNGRAGIGSIYPMSSRVSVIGASICGKQLRVHDLYPYEFVVGESRYFRWCDDPQRVTIPMDGLNDSEKCRSITVTFSIEIFNGRPAHGVTVEEFITGYNPIYRDTVTHSYSVLGIATEDYSPG